MEEALRARQLGMSTSHRQRIEERRTQKDLTLRTLMNDNENNRRHRQHYHVQAASNSYTSQGCEDDSDTSTSSQPALDFSIDSPSESSVRTLDSFLPTQSSHNAQISNGFKIPPSISLRIDTKEMESIQIRRPSQPKMQATLTTIADWNYDRFSVILDASDIEEEFRRRSEEDATHADSGDEEEAAATAYSPIEIATPVTFTMPKMSPRLVSISSFHGQFPSYHKPRMPIRQTSLRRHVSDQFQLGSRTEEIELAKTAEIIMSSISNASKDAMVSGNSSNQVSRSVSLTSHTGSVLSSTTSQSSQQSQPIDKSPKRKSSLPLLFGNPKNGPSRMSSFKKLIRSSTHGQSSTDSSQPRSMIKRQASTATLETHFESRTSSIEIPRSPAVARHPSPTKTQYSTRASSPAVSSPDQPTALPRARTVSASPNISTTPHHQARFSASSHGEFPLPPQQQQQPLPPPSLQQLKPISKLRSRSGSIGHALKSIGSSSSSSSSSTKRTDQSVPPPPPLPSLIIPPLPNRDLRIITPSQLSPALSPSTASTPPPLTPKNPRRSMATYSPFPSTTTSTTTAAAVATERRPAQPAAPVGLGLRY